MRDNACGPGPARRLQGEGVVNRRSFLKSLAGVAGCTVAAAAVLTEVAKQRQYEWKAVSKSFRWALPRAWRTEDAKGLIIQKELWVRGGPVVRFTKEWDSSDVS